MAVAQTEPSRLRRLGRRLRSVPRSSVEGTRIVWRAAALSARTSPRLTAAYIAVAAVGVILPVAQVWLVKIVVDRLAETAGDGAGMTRAVLLPAVLYVLTLILPDFLQPIRYSLESTVEDRAVGLVDRTFMGIGDALPDLTRIERREFHDELRLLQETSRYLPLTLRFLQQGVGMAVTVAGMLALLGRLHPLLPVVLALTAIPHLLVERRQYELVYQAMQDHSQAAREMDYYVGVVTEPAAAKEVRVFGLGAFFLSRFHDRNVAARAELARMRYARLRTAILFGGLHGLALAGGLWYVAQRAGDGTLTLGDVALYLNTTIQFQTMLYGLPVVFGLLYESQPYLRALFRLQDEAGPGVAGPPPGEGRSMPVDRPPGIALRHVSFTYPDETEPVLRDVSAELPAGKTTALVGANGAGKSTLVKLLTRMYDPTAGRIEVDGIDARCYDLADLRRRVAVVFQDFAHFSLTLGENIAVGRSGGDVDGRVAEAARWAGVDEVAAKLERGYDTELTRRFEGGVELSGGEWQKVALARGAVRDAPMVLLDEPNAALDADAEHRMLERFRELAAGRTVLLISDRLSTVRIADHILVLEDGRIVEAGAHDELVARGGRYATLFAMQAGRYRDA